MKRKNAYSGRGGYTSPFYMSTGDKIAVSLMAASAVALGGALIYKGMSKAKAKSSTPTPAETYRGLKIFVRKDGAAWRWTVNAGTTPLATGLSVLETEARIAARNWIDATGAGV